MACTDSARQLTQLCVSPSSCDSTEGVMDNHIVVVHDVVLVAVASSANEI